MYAFKSWVELYRSVKLDEMMKNPAIRRLIKVIESMDCFAQKTYFSRWR